MSTLAAVSVDNNLAASQTSVAVRSADDEFARWIHMVFDVTLEEVEHRLVGDFTDNSRHEDVDHIVLDLLQHLLVSLLLEQLCRSTALLVAQRLDGDEVIVLGRHHDSVDTQRFAVLAIFYSHLALSVRTQVSHLLTLATNVGKRTQDVMAQVE